MDRLTEKNDETYFYPHCFEECNGAHDTCSECEFDEKVCMRIGKYEDTGLTPEQIMELKARDTAKAPEEYDGHWYKCPRCGKYAGGLKGNFCHVCGQRIRWEE